MIMRRGVPKVDLAFYYFEVPFKFGASVYNKSDLNEFGKIKLSAEVLFTDSSQDTRLSIWAPVTSCLTTPKLSIEFLRQRDPDTQP